jgi:hypothetical protein
MLPAVLRNRNYLFTVPGVRRIWFRFRFLYLGHKKQLKKFCLYKILPFVIPFYYGSGSGKANNVLTVPTVPVPQH